MGSRSTRVFALAAGAAAVAWAVRDIPAALGARPGRGRAKGGRRERMLRSPQYRDGAFHNPVPATVLPPGSGRQTFREMLADREHRKPSGAIPVVTPRGDAVRGDGVAPAGGAYLTWYGHSSVLVECDGRRVLLDPVWSERCSPSRLVGPRRLHPMPVPVRRLPAVDAIVISHDHYDHLDAPTVRALTASQAAPFVVPLGVGAHLERWGVPRSRIIELDWHESADVAGLTLVATPARHFSGRSYRRDETLWASWVIAGPSRRIFYSGDTGYFPGFAEIGAAYGPFDATLIQIGAYGPAWPDIHLTPEDGVATHLDVSGDLLVPVHWGTFSLAFHAWAEPVDRLWREAKARGVTIAVPRPGERIDVDAPPPVDGWWQTLA